MLMTALGSTAGSAAASAAAAADAIPALGAVKRREVTTDVVGASARDNAPTPAWASATDSGLMGDAIALMLASTLLAIAGSVPSEDTF
jgi:hypothetical protein